LLPGLWMFAYYVNPLVAAGLGLVYVIGRFMYQSAYMADPGKRSLGFSIGALPMITLVIGGMVGAVLRML
ncbi:MAG: MAPEG family protein, partial [Halioglobus sp.]|nr:MAPEG family protein [Halioglobus sp.]